MALDDNFLFLKARVPRQIDYSALVEKVSSTLNIAVTIGTASTYGMAFFLSNSFWRFVGMINSLQLIFHLAMLNINFPPNVIVFYKNLMPIVKYDVFDKMGLSVVDSTSLRRLSIIADHDLLD